MSDALSRAITLSCTECEQPICEARARRSSRSDIGEDREDEVFVYPPICSDREFGHRHLS